MFFDMSKRSVLPDAGCKRKAISIQHPNSNFPCSVKYWSRRRETPKSSLRMMDSTSANPLVHGPGRSILGVEGDRDDF